MIINLYSNAIKFTLKGGSVCLECQFLEKEGDHGAIEIKVIDTGVGIKKLD